LKEVVDGNVIAMRKKFFYEDPEKLKKYKGPKNFFPFEVSLFLPCLSSSLHHLSPSLTHSLGAFSASL